MNGVQWNVQLTFKSRLRRLIEDNPARARYIQTVWGVGYVFVPDGAE